MIDAADAPSYFVRTGPSTFQPTRWTSGAWRETEQHFSPIGGLIVHAVDQFVAKREPHDDLMISRIHVDILGVVQLVEMDVQVRPIRPGRTIELLEVSVQAGGRTVALAKVWRLAAFDTTSVAGGEDPPFPSPHGIDRWQMSGIWPGDYIASLDVRAVREPTPGRGAAWITSDIELVANEPCSDVARFVRLVDTANGVAVRQSPRDWMYPNLDLTIAFTRQPSGAWVGFDTTVMFGPTGQGLTSTVLHDEHGVVGRAEQTLTVRRIR